MELGAYGQMGGLCDEDVIYLHNTFLTVGFHVVPVSSLDEGRLFMYAFLSSVSSISTTACLGVASSTVPNGVSLLYEQFRHYGFAYGAIDLFLLEEFHYSFCWIEYTPELGRCSWFKHFCTRLYDFNLLRSASVVLLV